MPSELVLMHGCYTACGAHDVARTQVDQPAICTTRASSISLLPAVVEHALCVLDTSGESEVYIESEGPYKNDRFE